MVLVPFLVNDHMAGDLSDAYSHDGERWDVFDGCCAMLHPSKMTSMMDATQGVEN